MIRAITADDGAAHASRNSPAATAAGVYGMRLTGLGDVPLLTEVDADAPVLDVSVEFGRVTGRVETITDDDAEISLLEGAWLSLRRSGQAHFVLPCPVAAEEILHPRLVPAAGTFNAWHGRQVLHGGAFCRDGKALAIIGAKEDGKSSLLAWLAQHGDVDVLADDLVIIDRGTVFAGPRCIDLRPTSAQVIAEPSAQRLVRDTSRLRLTLDPCPPTARLAGIVLLAWDDDPAVRLQKLTPSEGIVLLLPHALNAGRNGYLLDLLQIPIWILRRPKSWRIMPAVESRLLELLD